MTVSVLNRNKWLLQALGRLGGSSCFPEKGRGPPPAEDRRAGSGPLNIDYLIIQDNRNPWLFKHGTAPSSQGFHHPNELLEEWDAKMSSSNSPKSGTQTATMESSPLELKALFSYFLSLFLSLFFLLPPSYPLFFLFFHCLYFFHPSIDIIRMSGKILSWRKAWESLFSINFWCIKGTKKDTWVVWLGPYKNHLEKVVCLMGCFSLSETFIAKLADESNFPTLSCRGRETLGFSRLIPANWTASVVRYEAWFLWLRQIITVRGDLRFNWSHKRKVLAKWCFYLFIE